MADQRITFEQLSTGDTGARDDEEAILPLNDGETLRQAVLRRPTENLRGRTEIVREALETLKYLTDTNIQWIISSAPGGSHPQIISWDPAVGEVRFSDDICLQPLASIDADRLTQFFWDFADTLPNSGSLIFTNTLTADKGGDTLEVCLSYALTTATINITTSGSPVNRINVEVSNDGSVALSQLRTALLALPEVDTAAGSGVLWVLTNGGDLATLIDTAGTIPIAGTYDTVDTANREMHILSAGTWAAWNTTVLNPILDGDTVGIQYPFLVDPASFFDPTSTLHGGRRQRYGTDTDVVASDLFKSSDPTLFNQPGGATIHQGPALLPLCIPICKRIGNDLLFFDKTFVKNPTDLVAGFQTLNFGENASTVDRFTGAGIALTAYVGTGATVVPFSIAADIIQTNLEDLVDSLNNKGSLNAAETVTEKWVFDATGVVSAKSSAIVAYSKGSELLSLLDGIPDKTTDAAVKGNGQTLAVASGYIPGTGVLGVGGDNTTLAPPGGTAGIGGVFVGGDSSSASEGYGGRGIVAAGGLGGATAGNGGHGIAAYGGEANLAHACYPGDGGFFYGGSNNNAGSSLKAGHGVYSTGGETFGTGEGGEGVHGVGGYSAAGLTGIGVYGQSTHGYGVKVEGDTTSPRCSALHVVPQNATPTSLENGNIWINSSTKGSYYYGGTARRASSARLSVSGTHTGVFGNTLIDSTKNWGTNNLIGMYCRNLTLGTRGVVTVNTTNTLTAYTHSSPSTALTFNPGDSYVINPRYKVPLCISNILSTTPCWNTNFDSGTHEVTIQSTGTYFATFPVHGVPEYSSLVSLTIAWNSQHNTNFVDLIAQSVDTTFTGSRLAHITTIGLGGFYWDYAVTSAHVVDYSLYDYFIGVYGGGSDSICGLMIEYQLL